MNSSERCSSEFGASSWKGEDDMWIPYCSWVIHGLNLVVGSTHDGMMAFISFMYTFHTGFIAGFLCPSIVGGCSISNDIDWLVIFKDENLNSPSKIILPSNTTVCF